MDTGQPKTLFDDQPAAARPPRKELTGQILSLYTVLKQSDDWLTILEIQEQTGHPQNSISANLRNLRKAEFHSHNVVGRRRAGWSEGSWEYRLFESDDGRIQRRLEDNAG